MGQQENNNSYPPGTIVFAKLKGYPWWPAKIEDERTVPAKVMKQKTKSRSPIWTVFFFGSKDYGFFGPDSIRPFNKADVEKDLKAKKFKTKDLERAIREALDPTWIDDDDEEEGKAAMEKRKSKDMTELTRKPTTLNKKSKIGKATGGQDTPSINKRGVNQDEQLEKVKRRKSMSQEQEDDLSNGHDRPSASPVAGLNKDHESPEFTRDFKRLYHLRHRLQKMMYEKEQGTIPIDDYPKISQTLKEVEDAPMTYDLLRHTKIGKVVKCGIGYEFENDTEFNIHERCQQLMRKWKELFVDTRDQLPKGDDKESATASTSKEE